MQWDNRNRGGPPDLGEMIKKARDSIGPMKGGKYLWGIVIVIILAIILVYTAVYRIPPGHRGVVLRFGKYSHTAMPGINLNGYQGAHGKGGFGDLWFQNRSPRHSHPV